MSRTVVMQLKDALDAYIARDLKLAHEVRLRDQEIDQMYNGLFREFLTHMLEDPRNIKDSLNVTWCARSLERVGDHCKNICEYVIYLVKGKDVRHTNLESIREALLGE